MDQLDNQAEQLECFEFLDLSEVDDRERNQLATTLYAREEEEGEDGQEAAARAKGDHEEEQHNKEGAYWKTEHKYNRTLNSRRSRGPKQQQQQHPLHRREPVVFSTEEENNNNYNNNNNNNGSVVDSRPVSRTESVLTDISSSYLSSSQSSLHVPNNAQQYPGSVTSPPLVVNIACNGGDGPPSWPAEAAAAGVGPQHSAYGATNTAILALHPPPLPPQESFTIRQQPPIRNYHQPRHGNPQQQQQLQHPPALNPQFTGTAGGPHELLANGGGGVAPAMVHPQQQQQQQQLQPQMVTSNGGGGVGGSSGGFGRAPGVPVVVGGAPPHPHGPLIRGNLVPRLLAPLPTGSSGGGLPHQGPLYAIVKPQLVGPSKSNQQPGRTIAGGPPMHVCVPVVHPKQLGTATGPVNGVGIGELGFYGNGISFDSGNVSSATTGSSSGRPGSESVDVTDADASTSSSTLTTSEIIERGDVAVDLPPQPLLPFHPQPAEDYQKTAHHYQNVEMSQQQQQQTGGSGGSNSNNTSNQGTSYQQQQQHGGHYHGQQQQQQQQAFMAQGAHMYQMLPPSLPSNVFVGNMTANVNLHGVMSHPFIPAAASAVAAAAGGQQAFIEMSPQQQHQVSGGVATNAQMIHGGHDMVQQQLQQQPGHPQLQHQPHHQSQGHMMGGGARGRGRGRGRGGNNSSHRREYGGGGRIHHQGQSHMQHIQSQQQQQQPHHHQQANPQQVHQHGGGGPHQQPTQASQQPEMMTQIIDQQQVMNPSGWFYYTPYPGYYNQIAGHHQAAAAQHATGHPIYVPGPPMPMYGHHMMGGYPQGMFMYPPGATPNAGAQGVPVGPSTGPAAVMSPEYGFGEEAGKGANFVPVSGEEGQFEVIQGQQQPQLGEPMVQAVGGAAPTQIWTQDQGGPVPIEFQEVMVSPCEQQVPAGEGGEGFPDATVADQQQGFMEQSRLNPNVANFMTLKQQQEMNEQQQQQQSNEQVYSDGVEQQQVMHGQPVQLIATQEMMVQPGFEHLAAHPQQALAYDMTGQPVVVTTDQGEVAYMASMDGGLLVAGSSNEYEQPQQVPLNAAGVSQLGGEDVQLIDPQQQQQQPTSVVYTSELVPGNNLDSPKVPVVMKPIVSNNNNTTTVNNAVSPSPQTVALPLEAIAPNRRQDNVPNVEGYISTLVEEKLVIEGAATAKNNKTWAQQAGGSAQVHRNNQRQQSHDSNNNVAASQGTTSAAGPVKKVVATTSVAVTAAPGRSPMTSPKVRHEAEAGAVVNGSAGPKNEMVHKANAILQTDAVPHQTQKKLETNTVSVTATPAAINGGAEKPQQAPAPAPSAPSSWASLFASSQKSTVTDTGSNGPVVGSRKPVAKVLPFEGTQVQPATQNTAGSMSYSAASSMGLAATTQSVTVTATAPLNNLMSEQDKSSLAERRAIKLGEFLSKYQIDNTNVSLNPRGLTNRSNYCYINAIVQALVACPPFYHVMKQIQQESPGFREKTNTPIIDAIVDLVNEFSPLTDAVRIHRREKGPKGKEEIELNCPPPFEPTVIHKILNSRGNGFKIEGRQEDAEEFLSYLLNGLNDEMLELTKMLEKPVQNGVEATNGEPVNDEGDDWQVIVNNRNKGTVTRTTDFGRTPISDIFRGQVRSRLQREGDHSTDVIQPFFTLQLDIEKVSSVKEALEMLVVKDQLEGVTCTKTNQEVAAWQQYTLEKLPMVLILHLKLFDYNMGGCTKILKTVSFPIELKIDTKILSSKKYQAKQKMYKLIAVVYHDGKEASKGHYITDVYNVAYSSWIRYDDSMVRPVKEHQVLHPKAPRVPYLLYYRRCDTIATPPQQAGSGSAAAEHHQVSSSSTTDRTTTTHSSSGRNSAGGR